MTGALKFWDGAAWQPVSAQGPQGSAGPQGPTGAQGANGSRGSLWYTYTGSGTPAAGTFSGEADGDYAVRSRDSEVFQRVSGAWVDQGYAMGYAMQTAARAYRSAAFTTVSGWQKIPVDTTTYDTGSNLQINNGRYICPAAGSYQVNVNVQSTLGSSASINVGIGKNGSFVSIGTSETISGPAAVSGSDIIQCNAGDILELWCYTNGAYALSTGTYANYFSIVKIDVGGRPGVGWRQYTGSGTPTVSGSPSDLCVRTSDGEVFQMVGTVWTDQGWSLLGTNMNALYAARGSRTGAVTINATSTKVPIDTKTYDPGNNISTANGRYVCPVSGFYHAMGQIETGGSTNMYAQLRKNGSPYANGNASSATYQSVVADVIQCNAGDYIELWVYAQANTSMSSDAFGNYLSVMLVAATAVQAHPLQPASQARVYRSAALTLTANSLKGLPTDTVAFDAGNNVSSDRTYYTVPAAGYYQVEVSITATATAAGQTLQSSISNTGVTTYATNQASAAGPLTATASDVLRCNAGDVLSAAYNCSAALAMVTGSANTYFTVSLMGTIPTSAPAHAARAYRNAALTPTANVWTKVPVDAVSFDPGGNIQTANGRYVCPVSGIYDVLAMVQSATSGTGTYTNYAVGIWKNGVQVSQTNMDAAVVNGTAMTLSDKIQCNAGDYLELYVYNAQGTAIYAGPLGNWLAVSLLTGSQIGPQGASGPRGTQWFIYNGSGTPAAGSFAGELDGDWAIRKVDGENFQRISGAWVDQSFTNRSTAAVTAARAFRAATYTMPTATNAVIPFDTVSYDTGGNLNVGGADGTASKGRFTCPTDGYYAVDAEVGLTGLAGEADFSATAAIWVNGVQTSYGTRIPRTDIYGQAHVVVTDIVKCRAGDYIDIRVYVSASGATLLGPGTSFAFMSVALLTAGPGPQGPAGPQGVPGNSVDAKTAARASAAVAQALPNATATKVVLGNINFDAGNNFNAANNRYVCPVAGFYQVEGLVSVAGAITISTYLMKNGSSVASGSTVSDGTHWPSGMLADIVQCNAGDYFELACYPYGAVNTINGYASTYLSVVKVDTGGPAGPQGPQGIPGGVGNTGARAYRNGAFTSTAAAWTKIPLDAITTDLGGHINTSQGRYNVTSAGWYQVNVQAALNTAAAGGIGVACYLNGNQMFKSLLGEAASSAGTLGSAASGQVACQVGDYLELWVWSSAATPLLIDPAMNYLSAAQVDQAGPQGPPGGAANQVASAYSIVQGYTADRSFSPALTSLGEVANVLATLIDDMKNAGLIRP